MAIKSIINHDEPYDTFIVQGSLSPAELLDNQRQRYGRDNVTPRSSLWDVRGMRQRTESRDMFTMVEDSTAFWPKMSGGRTAILVKGRDQLSGVRMFLKLAEAMPRQIQIFTCEDEAADWLCDPIGNQRDYLVESASAS